MSNQQSLKLDTSDQIKIDSLTEMLAFYPGVIGLYNENGVIDYVNKSFTDMFGYTLNDLPTVEVWMKLAYPNDAYREEVKARWHAHVNSLKQGKDEDDTSYFVTCKDGKKKKVVIRGHQFKTKLVVDFNDITSEWQAERRLKAQNNMLEMVAKGQPLIDILDQIVEHVELEDSSAVCSILLMDKSGKHLRQSSAPNLPDFYNQAIDGMEIGEGIGSCGEAAYTKQRVVIENVLTHDNWQPFLSIIEPTGLKSCWSEPVLSSQDKVLGTFAIYHQTPSKPSNEDVALIKFAANIASIAIENHNTYEQLEHQAYHDYLTGIANRRYFIQRADEEFNRSKRFQNNLSVLMLDIDHFKKVNDKFGHSTGDLVLQKLVELSINALRDIDLMGRLGGEEFAILLPHTDREQAIEVAERLRLAVEISKLLIEDKLELRYTISIGVSSLTAESESIEMLFQQADEALYIAKHSGRNKVSKYVASFTN